MLETSLERRLRAALRAPVATQPDARDRIMARIHDAAREAARTPSSRVSRARLRHSIGEIALAAGIGSIAVAGSLGGPAPVTPSIERAAIASAIVHDTMGGTLLDTLRLVRQWSLPAGELELETRYAAAVDMTRFVPDPAAARLRSDDTRLHALLRSSRTSD